MPADADTLARLMSELAAYDGKDTSFLRHLDGQFSDAPTYADCLIELAASPTDAISDGATWLLKLLVDTARPISRTQLVALIDKLPQVTSWGAQLHLCQFLSAHALKDMEPGQLVGWLTPLLGHDRPFLRAWSLTALFNLARHNASLHAPAKAAMERARDDPTPSVQARARTIRPL